VYTVKDALPLATCSQPPLSCGEPCEGRLVDDEELLLAGEDGLLVGDGVLLVSEDGLPVDDAGLLVGDEA